MSEAFASIKKGLEEAIEYSRGKAGSARVFHPRQIDVKQLRTRIGMSQERFAESFGISLETLRNWERGERSPQGPARVLLTLLAKNPRALLKVMNQ